MPVVPLYAKSLGAGAAEVGLINSAFFMMAGVLSLPFGMLSDRVGRKFMASSGLLILSATSFLLYFSKTPAHLMWIYLLFGVGLAGFGPTMMSFVADLSPPTHLGRSYGWYTTALYSGMSLGPAAGGFVAEKYGFLEVFLVSGLLVLLNLGLAAAFLPRSHHSAASKKDESETKSIVKGFFKNRPLWACWLTTLGGCFGLGMFITFVPLHANSQHLTVGQIGLVFFAQGLCNALSRIPLGHLSDMVEDRRKLVVMGFLGLAASMAGFAVSTTIIHFIVFAVGLGISMGLAFTSIGALIAEVVSPHSRGLAMGGYNTCIYFGIMLSSAFMGVIIQKTSFSKGFFLTAIIIVLFALAFSLLMRGSSSGDN
jgi:MFS family permease